ncbi:hypothetical protein Taro_015121 [Colocasia esculenta]|uniref:Transmembrane protein n=1 Tax=Colocasia esculenta TaxID=4460 RepID=A0A843UL89_COLES|nr:hypothetical protein [Colocasia esculenta]
MAVPKKGSECVAATTGGACCERGCCFARAEVGFVLGLRIHVGVSRRLREPTCGVAFTRAGLWSAEPEEGVLALLVVPFCEVLPEFFSVDSGGELFVVVLVRVPLPLGLLLCSLKSSVVLPPWFEASVVWLVAIVLPSRLRTVLACFCQLLCYLRVEVVFLFVCAFSAMLVGLRVSPWSGVLLRLRYVAVVLAVAFWWVFPERGLGGSGGGVVLRTVATFVAKVPPLLSYVEVEQVAPLVRVVSLWCDRAACPVFSVRRHRFSVVWLASSSIIPVCVSACASAVLGGFEAGVACSALSGLWLLVCGLWQNATSSLSRPQFRGLKPRDPPSFSFVSLILPSSSPRRGSFHCSLQWLGRGGVAGELVAERRSVVERGEGGRGFVKALLGLLTCFGLRPSDVECDGSIRRVQIRRRHLGRHDLVATGVPCMPVLAGFVLITSQLCCFYWWVPHQFSFARYSALVGLSVRQAVTVTWDPQPRASVRVLFRCRPASPSHCLALLWLWSHVGRLGVGPQLGRAAVTPDRWFGNPFLGAVRGGTRVCSSLTSWRVQGPGWFCLWALDLVEVEVVVPGDSGLSWSLRCSVSSVVSAVCTEGLLSHCVALARPRLRVVALL